MLNIKWITDKLAISPAFDMKELNEVRSAGFDAIVDVRSEYQDDAELIRQEKMEYLNVSVDDTYAPTNEQIDTVMKFANPILDKGKKILVHCQNGYGRSPAVAVAILVKRGMNVADAVGLMEDKHPTVNFSEHQQKFIYSLS